MLSSPLPQKKKVGNKKYKSQNAQVFHITLSNYQWKLKMDLCSSPHSINFLIYAAEVDLNRTSHPQYICGICVSVNDVVRSMLFQLVFFFPILTVSIYICPYSHFVSGFLKVSHVQAWLVKSIQESTLHAMLPSRHP